ncbi:MAG: insulinase family protein [Myxococcota bacterium]
MSPWLVLAAPALAGGPPRPDLVPHEAEHYAQLHDVCFGSGLRVVVQESHDRPLVTVRTVHSGGWGDDPVGQEGTAHLAEHLWYRSDADDAPVDQQLEGVGASFNAFTGPDTVSFLATAPADALPALLRLEGRRLADPLGGVTDDEIAVERGVVRAELYTTGELESDLVLRPLLGALLPTGHRWARGATSAASLAAIDRPALEHFVASHWRPDQTTLVVVGDVDAQTLPRELMHALPRELLAGPGGQLEGSCPQRALSDAPPPDPRTTAPVAVRAPVADPIVVVGWTLPGGWRAAAVANEFAAPMAEAALSFAAAQRRGGEDLGCSLQPGPGVSLLACAVALDGRREDEVVDEITDALRLLGRIQWDTVDLTWAEAGYLNIRRRLRDSIDGIPLEARAEALADHVHFSGSPRYTRDRLDWLEQTDWPRIEATFDLLRPERMAVVAVTPAEGAEFAAGETDWLTAPRERRPPPPEVDAALLSRWLASGDLDDVEAWDLDNGLHVVVAPVAGGSVRAGLVARGGYWSADAPGVALPGWAALSLQVPTPVGQWHLAQDGYAEYVSAAADPHDLDDVLYLLRQVPERARLPAGRAARLARKWAAQAPPPPTAGQRVQREALRRLFPSLAGEAVAVPDKAALRAWHARTWHPASNTLVVVGPVSTDRVRQEVQARFGDWAAPPEAEPFGTGFVTAAPVRPARAILAVEAPALDTAVLTLTCAVPGGEGAQVLAGAVRTAAVDRLREEQGLAYFVQGGVVPTGGGGLLQLSTSTAPDAAGEVVATWLGLLGAPLGDDDVRWAELGLATELQPWLGSRDPLFATLAGRVARGGDPRDLARLPAQLAGIDADAVRAAAEGCAGHEIVGVVGPAAALEAVAARGFSVERLP